MLFGVVPTYYGRSAVIPLVKNTGDDLTFSENYRGITLKPVISKLFEMQSIGSDGDDWC